MIDMPSVRTETEYIGFGGGLDLVSPAVTIKPGMLIGCKNYIPDINGGYRLFGMYERFDGRQAPSTAVYIAIACTLTSTPAIGATVTIGAATGLFAGAVTGGIILAGVVGVIPTSTTMTVGGSPIGTTASSLILPAPTPFEDATRTTQAAAIYRALITAVPGSGPIRGIVQFGANTYAVRDNAGGTAGVIHMSSSSGWTPVALGEEILFSNANVSVNEGDTITQGGVTALVRRIALETGSLASGVNTGRLVISGRMGGSFAAGAATTSGGGAITLSGAEVAQALPPGGQYQFDTFNFYGQITTERLYGCNGVGRAFEFDGTVLTFIRSGAVSDTPKFIRGHRNYLYLAIGSSVINSSIGNPLRFVTAEGASEIAVGDTITGLESLPGEALGILCRNSSYQLNGASSATWSLQIIQSDVGCVAYSSQTMSDTYMLDDRGITSVKQSDVYGNFEAATLTRKVQPLINSARGKVVGSWVNRQRSLYSLMLNDGTAIVLGIQGETLFGVTTLKYDFTPSYVFSGEDANGIERIFAGDANGMVYELDKGQSADGQNLEAFIRLTYNSSKSPRVRKRYRKMALLLASDNYSTISFSAEMSYGTAEIPAMVTSSGDAVLGGAFWDTVNWDEFYWSSQDVYEPEFSLAGTGTNVAFLFYKNNAIDQGHVIQGGTVHYTARRLQR